MQKEGIETSKTLQGQYEVGRGTGDDDDDGDEDNDYGDDDETSKEDEVEDFSRKVGHGDDSNKIFKLLKVRLETKK